MQAGTCTKKMHKDVKYKIMLTIWLWFIMLQAWKSNEQLMTEKNDLPYLAGGGGYFYPLIFAFDSNFPSVIFLNFFLQIKL